MQTQSGLDTSARCFCAPVPAFRRPQAFRSCTPAHHRNTDSITSACRKTISNLHHTLAPSPKGAARNRCVRTRASGGGDDKQPQSAALGPERWKLYAGLVASATAAALLLTYGGGSDSIQEALYGDGLDMTISSGPTLGDGFGALLWATSLYFCSPWQLLLLFLGDIKTERPSDWLIQQLGRATGQSIDDVQYSAPPALRAAAVAICGFGGAAIAWAFETGLGDATWSVSTGLGACMASAVYEVGRPKRFSREEAEELDAKWRDFASFAKERLQRSGRCHETEVASAFRQSFSRYRSTDAMPDTLIRDFVRNWHPDAGRTPSGFYKNLSLQQRVDPFSGEASGSTIGSTEPAAAASRASGSDGGAA